MILPFHNHIVKFLKKLYNKLKQYLHDLVTNQQIKKSYFSQAGPTVFVRKMDRTMRFCIDYRQLNKENLPDKMPLPRIQDILDNLGGQKYFKKLDMSKAYHRG